jgi:hypothetical protein
MQSGDRVRTIGDQLRRRLGEADVDVAAEQRRDTAFELRDRLLQPRKQAGAGIHGTSTQRVC